MDEPERLTLAGARLVRVVESSGSVRDDTASRTERDRLVLASGVLLKMPQVLSGHILHRQEIRAALLPEIEDLDQVRVIEAGSDPRFGEKHLAKLFVIREMRKERLDDDQLLESLRPGGPG